MNATNVESELAIDVICATNARTCIQRLWGDGFRPNLNTSKKLEQIVRETVITRPMMSLGTLTIAINKRAPTCTQRDWEVMVDNGSSSQSATT